MSGIFDTLVFTLADQWQPQLIRFREERQIKNEVVFCGLTAFAGIQMNFWPAWIRACQKCGHPIDPVFYSMDVEEAQVSDSPWLCLSFSYGKNVLLVHLQTKETSQDRNWIAALLLPQMQHLFRSMEANGDMIHYDLALATLIKMGYTDYEIIAAVTPLLPRVYDERAKQTKKIPIIQIAELKEQWDFWTASVAALETELVDFLQEYLKLKRSDEDLVAAFQTTASLLWQELDKRQVIKIKGSQERGFWPLRKQTSDQFRGNLILYGEHERFWESHFVPYAVVKEGDPA